MHGYDLDKEIATREGIALIWSITQSRLYALLDKLETQGMLTSTLVPGEAQNPGISVTFNFANSQQLAQQLAEGAPADLFASANPKQMEVAVGAGRVDEAAIQTVARNRLVVIYPEDNPAGLQGLEDLARPDLKLVMTAKEVPVGQYSREFLEKAGQEPALGPSFQQAVLKNFVLSPTGQKILAKYGFMPVQK